MLDFQHVLELKLEQQVKHKKVYIEYINLVKSLVKNQGKI